MCLCEALVPKVYALFAESYFAESMGHFAENFFSKVGNEIGQSEQGSCLHLQRITDDSGKDVSAKKWRRTFRQKKFAETSQAKIFCRNVSYDMWAYPVYARSPPTSQRPAPTTIASRSPFPLGLCSCSTSLSKMGIKAAPRGRGALEEMGTYPRDVLCFPSFPH